MNIIKRCLKISRRETSLLRLSQRNKKSLSSDFFNNFHKEALQFGNSGRVALTVNEEILYTRINDQESDLDSIWILGLLGKLKLLIAAAYIRRNSIDCLKSFLQQLEAAQHSFKSIQLDGSIFMGDLNARHEYWGDSTDNLHGLELYNHSPYKLSINNYGDLTFLSSNGNSIIDLFIFSGKMTQHTFFELSCNYDVELFTGAPRRGHVPVLLDISPLEYSKVVNSRLWLEKADWTSWTNTLEDLSKDIMEIDDCNEIWSRIKQSISEASDKFFPTKKSYHHSKPFWNADLSAASKEVSKCRKQFRLKSNYSNGLALDSAKEHFKTLLALEASNWMQHLLREFGYKRGKYVWKTYNRLYKKNTGKVGPIRTSSDQFACKE